MGNYFHDDSIEIRIDPLSLTSFTSQTLSPIEFESIGRYPSMLKLDFKLPADIPESNNATGAFTHLLLRVACECTSGCQNMCFDYTADYMQKPFGLDKGVFPNVTDSLDRMPYIQCKSPNINRKPVSYHLPSTPFQ